MEEEEEGASALEGAAEEQQPFRQGHVGSVCDESSSQGARACFRVPADSSFPVSIGCWQGLAPGLARTNTQLSAEPPRKEGFGHPPGCILSLLKSLHWDVQGQKGIPVGGSPLEKALRL